MQHSTYIKTKLNKTQVGLILTPWSSSRANEYSKAKAIQTAIDILSNKSHFDEIVFTAGCYSEKSRCNGSRWKVSKHHQTIELLGLNDVVLKTWNFY